jgi:flagellar hook-associated protein 1 FlgK
VQDLQFLADNRLSGLSSEVNRLTTEIAFYNSQIVGLEVGGTDAGAIRDQRNLALQQMGEMLPISYYENANGTIIVSTSTGSPLVTSSGGKQLQLGKNSNGFSTILIDGGDMTADIADTEMGKIGAALKVRDEILPEILQEMNTLVTDLRDRVNQVHEQGFSLDGIDDISFFNPTSGAMTVDDLQVAITDPRQIAAGSTAAAGDNGNAKAIFNLAREARAALGGLTYADYASGTSSSVASKSAESQRALQMQDKLIMQIQQQREAVSGVSLDEEAADMIRYQRAFEASSRYFSIINDLTAELLQMVG